MTLSVNSGMRMKMRSKFPRQRTRKHNKKPNQHHKSNSKNKNPSAKPVVSREMQTGETSETCAFLSAPQKFSSTSMYFSICPVLNVSHVNICHHVLRHCEVYWEDLDFELFENEWRAASGIGGLLFPLEVIF